MDGILARGRYRCFSDFDTSRRFLARCPCSVVSLGSILRMHGLKGADLLNVAAYHLGFVAACTLR